MATGNYDARGVWQYGEDDPLYPWSTYMNRGQSSVSQAIAADRARLVELETLPAWLGGDVDRIAGNGWTLAPGYTLRYLKDRVIAVLQGTRVTRIGSSLTLAATTDYPIASGANALPPALRPAVQQEAVGMLYLGSGVGTSCSVRITEAGEITFRPMVAGTFGIGGANVLALPPMTWAVAL